MATVASVEGLFGAMYFGIGRGMGGLFGGFCFELLGASLTFKCFAVAAATCGMVFLITTYLDQCVKNHQYKLPEEQDKVKQELKTLPSTK